MSGDGSTTASEGTPVAVDITRDLRARATWVVLLGGPLTWFAHFMVVYLAAEAGCTGDGPGLEVFDPPVPGVVTVVATVVAVVLCLALTVWAYRRWRGQAPATTAEAEAARDRTGAPDGADPGGSLALIGLLLAVLSLLSVLFVGVPALWLTPC